MLLVNKIAKSKMERESTRHGSPRVVIRTRKLPIYICIYY